MEATTRAACLRRMQEGMRAMTDAEIAEKQRREAPGMMAADAMHGAAGMQNFWCTNEAYWIPEPPKPTFWQRLKRLFVRRNAKANAGISPVPLETPVGRGKD